MPYKDRLVIKQLCSTKG